jgi:hypothetical protein
LLICPKIKLPFLRKCTTVRQAISLSLALGLTALTPAEGASVPTIEGKDSEPTLNPVEGDLAYGDEQKFVEAALKVRSGIVLLNSKGGNLKAGIEIGKAIRLNAFITTDRELLEVITRFAPSMSMCCARRCRENSLPPSSG